MSLLELVREQESQVEGGTMVALHRPSDEDATERLKGDLVERLLGLLRIVGAVILFHDSAALIGHAYLIELLQIGGVDGEEADPLIDG